MPKYSHIPPSADALRTIRGLARTGIKYAEIGGGQDIPFEQAFSNIAHSYLRDKAPGLLDYELGFQLIDRNQENTKAVGVFGFKVGPQLLLGPVFFLNGDIKGHELLYIKNQDLFVPMKENWLDHILNKRPSVLGESVNKDLSQVGVMPPYLQQLSRSPAKFASAYDRLEGWEQDALTACAHWGTTNPKHESKYGGVCDLAGFLKEAGYQTLVTLFKTFEQYPRVKAAYDNFHGLEVIEAAVKEAKAKAAEELSDSVLKEAACRMTSQGVRCTSPATKVKPRAVPKPKDDVLPETPVDPKLASVAVQSYDEVVHTGAKLDGMSKGDREKLLKDKVLIKDERPDTNASRAYEVQTELKLTNPDASGLYDVLIKPGEFARCLVVMWPYSNHRRETFCTLVKLEDSKGGKSWLNTHPSNVWCRHWYRDEAYKSWVKGLPEPKELSQDGLYMLVSPNGEGSVPFEPEDKVLSGEQVSRKACFRDYASQGRAGWLPKMNPELSGDWFQPTYIQGGPRVTLTGKSGAKLRCTGGDLMVPEGFKLLKLKDPPKRDKDGYRSYDSDSSDPPPIYLGNMNDIDNLIGQKTASVKLASVGSEIVINSRRMSKLAGLVHLVRDHGLREKQARMMMARADMEKVVRFRVKYADQYYDMQKTGPSAPGFPEPYVGYDAMTGGNHPTMQKSEFNIKIPDMSASKTDRSIYRPMGPEPDYQQPAQPDRQAQQAALGAAQTGQKEIFDTAMIGGLLKAVHDDNLVDKYRGDLQKGLDRLGRILFLFYWHNEKFAERYGQQDMVEFEDGLRNAFESVGDILLFITQRAVDPHNDSLSNVDLGSVSNS